MANMLLSVALLAALFQSNLATTEITCTTSSITVTTDEAGLQGKYVRILDQTCPPVQLTDDGSGSHTAELPDTACAVPGPDDPFVLAFTDSDDTILDAVLADAECTAEASQSLSVFPTATISVPTSTLSDTLTATITITPSSTVLTLGEVLTVTIALDSASAAFYRIQVSTFVVKNGATSEDLVTAGCPTASAVTGYGLSLAETPDDSPPTSVAVSFKVFIPIDANELSATTVLTMTSLVILCTDPFTDCYDPTGCNGNEQFGRKRRQTEAANMRTVETTVAIFAREGSRDEFMTNVREELGLTEATRIVSEEDLCVNKTTSAVVLVILIVGMILCTLATCFMFTKLRKSRRLQEPDKSEFAYSNRSVKH